MNYNSTPPNRCVTLCITISDLRGAGNLACGPAFSGSSRLKGGLPFHPSHPGDLSDSFPAFRRAGPPSPFSASCRQRPLLQFGS